MKREIFLGIDTSNYTTSLAAISKSGELIANLKIPLSVKQGERGLRQSDAVFNHVKNIPEIMKCAEEYISDSEISAVGVSKTPRNQEGSYMPCFLAGVSAAQSIASSLSVPLYRFSHQCGHLMAAIYGSARQELLDGEFAALHVSGGTTEILKARYSNSAFSAELVGGTLDLNAGQLVDRVGTLMGLPFPSGLEMEKLALLNTKKIPSRKIKAHDLKINLSGIENLASALYRETEDKSLVSAFVLDSIEKAISSLCEAFREKFGDMPYLFAGGVMSNSIIRKSLENKFNASFAPPEFSADNAVGTAELTRRAFVSENV